MNTLELGSPLLGARDLIRECHELLRGERKQLTLREDYIRERLAYWRTRADEDDAVAA